MGTAAQSPAPEVGADEAPADIASPEEPITPRAESPDGDGPAEPLAPPPGVAEDQDQPPEGSAPIAPVVVPVPVVTPGEPMRVFREPVSQRPRSEPDPNAPAIPETMPGEEPSPALASPRWYDRIQLRGYTQFRYNRIPSAQRNDELINLQGDRSIGAGNGFAIRRARLILYGDLHDHVSIYLQPDMVSTAGGQMHTMVLRDWYTDIFFDRDHRFRLRLGQSKVPYGFENMQSSQNRLALDRNDALNSAVKDERDLGAFLYFTPRTIQQRFRYLVSSGLKGSGDYGVLALGVYNGQTANQPALTDDLHVIARFAYPFLFGSQYVEIGAGGYVGNYRVNLQTQNDVEYTTQSGDLSLRDARVFGTFVLYPQPLGFQAEATYGVGPAQGMRGAEDRTVVDSRRLWGGYAQMMLKVDELWGTVAFIPFVRATYYNGGKKFMVNAPHYVVRELEIGLEWLLIPNLEVVLAYDIVDRTSDVFPYDQQQGHVARIQVQVNYP